MADRVKWTTHKGHWVLRIDYSGLQNNDLLSLIAQVPSAYHGRAKGSVLCLIDVRDTRANDEVINAMKALVKNTTREYDRKVAILGISGVKKVLLITMNMFTAHMMQAFDRDEDALDWLVS